MGFDTPSGGGGAPTDAAYLTGSSNPDLSNETVINNPENIPDWEEDANSPDSATGVSNFTYSIGSSFDQYLKFVEITAGGNRAKIEWRVDGDTTANYRELATGGSLSTGADSWQDIANDIESGAEQSYQFVYTPAFNGKIAITPVTTGPFSGLSVAAGLDGSQMPPSQWTVFEPSGNTFDIKTEVYGRDI
jgi:hypothetical protein